MPTPPDALPGAADTASPATPLPLNAHTVLHEAVGFMSAEAFKSALKRLGWSQNQAATMLGYEPWAVKRWATGADPVPWLVARTLELYDQQPELEMKPRRVTHFDAI